ncbi:iron-sulfur cluster assembly scaffold protein [Patescibacteria group bacterium]
MTDQYSEEVFEHFRNPQNMGKIENADGIGTVGNPVCGDVMKLYIKVKDQTIKDIKFQTLGCGAAIATSSILTTLVKGKKIEKALKIGNKDITKALGGLPKKKLHCSLLAADALKEAVKDYRSKISS